MAKKRSTEDNKSAKWITVKVAAVHAQVSIKVIYFAARTNRLRHVRFGAGRNIRTTLEWVDQWLESLATGGPNK